MNAIAEPVEVGDYDIRGRDADQVFASAELSDAALTAAVWATARFDPSFPGWQLYRTITAGCNLFDRELKDWATSTAWALARSQTRRNHRPYITARGPWIDAAAEDALCTVIRGPIVPSARERGRQFQIRHETWLRIYKPMTAAMVVGFETFRSELHYWYSRVIKIANLDQADMVSLLGDARHLQYGPQTGNFWKNPDSKPGSQT